MGHGSCFLTRRAPLGKAQPDCSPTGTTTSSLFHSCYIWVRALRMWCLWNLFSTLSQKWGVGGKINEILVRALTGASRRSARRPAGIHTCSPAGSTSVSAEHKNRCSFVLLSRQDVSASHTTKFQGLFFAHRLFTSTNFFSLRFSQSVSNAFSYADAFLIIFVSNRARN